MSRRRLAFLLVSFVLSAGACQDLASPSAYTLTVADTLRASALNGTPLGSRSALSVFTPAVIAPDGNLDFDLAFDIDANGNTILIPVSKVAVCPRVCQVGLQVVSDSTFEQLTRARTRGYTYDSVTTVPTGKPVLIVAKAIACSTDLYSNDLYAKLVVDSVHAADRAIFFRIVTDPNCGFRGLVPGETPKN
jgi:hypothetical protein